MPVTFQILKDKKVETYPRDPLPFLDHFSKTGLYRRKAFGKIFAGSVDNETAANFQFENGFIGAIFDAYCLHNNLSIRPDDVWLAILIQFSLYLNANAEKFRKFFVSHDGKKELKSNNSFSFEHFARDMAAKMQESIIDNEVKNWILPNFTTTTENDITVASFIMMSSMQQYFSFSLSSACEIPNITLEGELKDWESILTRVQRFKKYDDKILNAWCDMLIPIIEEFCNAMTEKINADFWSKICHLNGSGGSGTSYLSGWVTAFSAFDKNGNWRGDKRSIVIFGEKIEGEWPIIDTKEITPGIVTVPFNFDGSDAMIFTGHFAFDAKNDKTLLAPRLDWIAAFMDEEKIKKYMEY